MKRKTNNYEDTESMALWSMAQTDPVLRAYLYHIPNGGNRNAREAGRMKKMGVRPGVSDYHLPVAKGIYNSLYVELKAKAKGYYPSVSTDQGIWRGKMQILGNAAVIVKGYEEALNIMHAYLDLEDGKRLSIEMSGKFDCLVKK